MRVAPHMAPHMAPHRLRIRLRIKPDELCGPNRARTLMGINLRVHTTIVMHYGTLKSLGTLSLSPPQS